MRTPDTDALRSQYHDDHPVHALSDEVDRLRDALRQYGGHDADCAVTDHCEHIADGWASSGPLPDCNCGWSAVLSRLDGDTERVTWDTCPEEHEELAQGELVCQTCGTHYNCNGPIG